MRKEPVYINPLTDFGFKRIFGTERNKDLLISFLNASLSAHVGIITDIEYLPTEQYGSLPSEKKVIFDIFCTDQSGRHFIVEMQRSQQKHFAHRTITYVSRVISHDAERGEREYSITPVYALNILDFDADEFRGKPDFFWQVKLTDNTGNIFSNNIIFFFIELRKFAAQLGKGNCSEDLHHWLYALKNIADLDSFAGVPDNEVFRKLFEECQLSKLSMMEKEEYRKSVLEYEDVQDAIAYSMEKGYERGLETGLKRGLDEGVKRGEEEGVMKVAQTMLSKGLDITLIASVTGLSEAEIALIKA